jgi:hypothetical protein
LALLNTINIDYGILSRNIVDMIANTRELEVRPKRKRTGFCALEKNLQHISCDVYLQGDGFRLALECTVMSSKYQERPSCMVVVWI